MIRIANGSAFWGDSTEAPLELLQGGPLDYLTLDYLAEITMSILQKLKARDPRAGYAHDFIGVVKRGREGDCRAQREGGDERGRHESQWAARMPWRRCCKQPVTAEE